MNVHLLDGELEAQICIAQVIQSIQSHNCYLGVFKLLRPLLFHYRSQNVFAV